MKTMMKTSLKASLIALALASIPLGSQAAGLGQINVFSGLGQPLRAEIQVTATPQELQSMLARIGSPDAFRQANITYSAAVAAIRVSVDTRAARPVIRLSSDRPINDPFVDLLVELNWANGRIAREYTFLLDPVDLVAQRPLAAPVNVPALAPAARQAPAPTRSAAARTASDTYVVGRGDTLNRIAAAHALPGVTLDQMLVALYRANRNAFDGANINRLRAGEVLSIPDADAARSIDTAQARREIRAQSLDFDAYRRGLAAASTRRAAAPELAGEQQSAGRIVPRVEEPQPSVDAGDQLKVSRSQPEGGAGDADAGARMQALEEELAVREKALEEASARLAQLEASMRDMQKLLELRSDTLAQLQQGAAAALTPVPASDPQSSEPAAPQKPVSEAPAAQTPPAEKPASAPQAADVPAPVPEPPGPGTTPATEAAAAPEAAKVAEPTAAKRPRRAPPPAPEPEPEPSMMESLAGDPTVLAGGGGILALLLAYLGIKAAQRRKQSLATSAGALGELAPGGQGVFIATGGQSVDTGASSIMQTDFSQSGFAPIDSDEGVDPVAEADVYMAYGRDIQAEEILQDALKADPERAAIYLKLLEIYAQRQDVRQFETIASELFGRTNGQGSEWHKAAALGRTLDADNLLYAESGGGDDVGAPRTEVPADAMFAAGAAVAASAQTRRGDGRAQQSSTEHEADLDLELGADHEQQAAQPAAQPASLASLDFTSSAPMGPSQSQMRDTWTVPGDLRQFSSDKEGDEDTGLPDLDMALAALEAEPVADFETGTSFDVGALDFDLDLGDEEPVDEEPVPESSTEPPSSPVAQAPAAQPTEDADLSFDLEIDEPEAAASADELAFAAEADPRPDVNTDPAATAAFDSAAVTMVGADGNLAASLEFELPDLGLQASPTKGMDLNQTLVQADALMSENESDGAQGEGVAEAAAVVDLENTSFDSSLLDFDFDIDMPMESSPASAAGLDLTSIDLDLDGFGEPAEEASETRPEAVKTTQGEQFGTGLKPAESSFEASSDEVDTKLELACAYDDMGDKEGALELLEEALREGSEAQQARAREMIARLS